MDRRNVLKGLGAVGVTSLAGCAQIDDGNSGGGNGGGDGGGNGNSDDWEPDNEVTVEFWTLFGGGDGEVMGNMVQQFNNNHDKIQIESQRLEWDQYYNRLYTALSGGTPPDLAVMHDFRFEQYADLVTPMDDYLSSDASDAYLQGPFERLKHEGQVKLLPLDIHPQMVWYNGDILEDAGVDTSTLQEDVQGFNDFEKIANQVSENTDKNAFSLSSAYTGNGAMMRWFIMLNQRNESVFDQWPNPSDVGFDNNTGQELAQYVADISGEYGWDVPDISEERAVRDFRSGNVAMITNGTWFVGPVREDLDNYGTFKPFITPGMENNITNGDAHTLTIPLNENRSEDETIAAVRAAEYLTQDASIRWGKNAGHLPLHLPTLESDELREADVWDLQLEMLWKMGQNDQFVLRPQVKFDMVKPSLWNWFGQVYAQNTNPEEGLQQGIQALRNEME